MSKGTVVVIHIASPNRRKDVWDGQDRPLEKTSGMVYGSILNFLAGNRTCLGWRIAVLELQTFICDVAEGFCILPGDVVVREFHGVSIPKVAGRPVRGGEVPLISEALSI
ncbi:hypothetical protein C8J57DRAFT_1518942 [Mycena rebaudengoi]|nr:hypothetical protein C8J57DRAFT_1518942 [Mycena rebaudengoi]